MKGTRKHIVGERGTAWGGDERGKWENTFRRELGAKYRICLDAVEIPT
jgi:hypothetical protein